MSLTTRVLIGLVAGFVLGLALAGSSSPAVSTLLAVVAPVGTIFINLIRMTVIPLVGSMLVASVGSLATSGALGRAGSRAAVVAGVSLGITAPPPGLMCVV
jgi:proton glutamate symport protein